MINVVHGTQGNGEANVDRIIRPLRGLGHGVRNVDYPPISNLAAALVPRRWNIKRQFRDARILMDMTSDGDNMVAHSRGCLIAHRSLELGRRFHCVFYFAPAMNVDFHFPQGSAKYIWIIHCPNDDAIKAAGLLPLNSFGQMGRLGYSGPSHDSIAEVQVEADRPAHSHYFYGVNLSDWSRFVSARVEAPASHMAKERKIFKGSGSGF